jgi:hypothetical protein
MNKEKHSIDDLFAGKLGQLEAIPSDDAWNKLQGRLQEQKKRKKGVIWWPYVSAAAVLLLIISFFLVNKQGEETGKPTIATNQQENSMPAKMDSITRDKNNTDNAQEVQSVNPVATLETKVLESLTEPAPEIKQITPATVGTAAVARLQKQQKSVKVLDSLPDPTQEQILVKQKTEILDTAATHENTLFIVVQLADEATATSNQDNGEQRSGTRKAEKFLSQLKKVKKGEFKELGIDANQIFALVRDKADRDKEESTNK